MHKQRVVLKEGKEKSILRRHPWIFSGAIESFPSFEDGDILPVHSIDGEFLAQGYFHKNNSIAGRILSFSQDPIAKTLEKLIQDAIDLRRRLFDPEKTNAYRLINSEGDGIPGLIVDVYHDILVIQANTCGIEKIKALLLEIIYKKLKPKAIYEKSHSSARRQEGLPDAVGRIYGEEVLEVPILENGVKFLVSTQEGQKTGLFLDQREMRQKIFKEARNRRVLNCFSYTGGFSLFALKGEAKHVDSVDICPKALQYCQKNTQLNGFDPSRHGIIQEDVFEFLKTSSMEYDIVILDPPAFAKKKADVMNACQGYKEINRYVLEKIPAGSLLLSCSCSYHIDEKLFQSLIFQASLEANRNVKIIGRHELAGDHPVSVYHPEGDYLKSLLLYIGS